MRQIETIYKVLNKTVDPVGFFNKLKNSEDAFLLESADIIKKYGEKSIGCVDPCLKMVIKNSKFRICSLNNAGKKVLKFVKGDFCFAENLKISDGLIEGFVKKEKKLIDEESRLKGKSVFDILRIIFKFKPKKKLDIPVCGLFGIISYDAIDYFERLPKQADSELPDIEFYFADKLFVMDHLKKKTYLIANVFDDKKDCEKSIERYEKVFNEISAYPIANVTNKNKVTVSVSDNGFKELVSKIKGHVSEGDIFQCVVSRTFKVKIPDKPLDVYARLKEINPGPYMFYFQNKDYILLGSSPETCLKVTGDVVEI